MTDYKELEEAEAVETIFHDDAVDAELGYPKEQEYYEDYHALTPSLRIAQQHSYLRRLPHERKQGNRGSRGS